MALTALHDTRDDGPHERHRESVVDVEFERSLSVVVAVVRQDVQESSDEIKVFTGNVGDLKDWTYSLADELGGGLDSFIAVLDEDGNLPCARRLEDAGELCDGLLENLRRTNINLGDHYHDWNVER